jgi:hypothetical protein
MFKFGFYLLAVLLTGQCAFGCVPVTESDRSGGGCLDSDCIYSCVSDSTGGTRIILSQDLLRSPLFLIRWTDQSDGVFGQAQGPVFSNIQASKSDTIPPFIYGSNYRSSVALNGPSWPLQWHTSLFPVGEDL